MPKTDKGLAYWEREFPELDPVRVAERLEALREARKLSAAEMARLIGVSTSQYGNWLPGTKVDGTPKTPARLNKHHVAAIARRCDVPTDYIILEEFSGISEPFQSELKAHLRRIRRSNAPSKRKS